jgi:hypothetical protein
MPEIPAINRSSMTISITGEPTGDYHPQMMPHLDLATDEAKAFLLALHDGCSPIVIADSRSRFSSNSPSRKTGRLHRQQAGSSTQLATVQRWIEL